MWATHRTLIFAAWHTLPIVRRSRFGFSDEVWLYSWGTGVWRSLVARFVRDEEAVGSNPATPTGNRRDRLVPAIFYRSAFRGLAARFGVAPQISGCHEACLISDTCTPRPLTGRAAHPARSPTTTRPAGPGLLAVCVPREWDSRMRIGCAHPDRLCACG